MLPFKGDKQGSGQHIYLLKYCQAGRSSDLSKWEFLKYGGPQRSPKDAPHVGSSAKQKQKQNQGRREGDM